MSEEIGERLVNRRDVLRSGAVAGGGLLATAVTIGGVTARDTDDQTSTVGYISRSSYRKLTGADDVDCAPAEDGWGGSFYVKRLAEDSGGEPSVSVDLSTVPAAAVTGAESVAYTVTVDEHVTLTGGPSGHGPWQEPCGSWVFVDGDAGLEPGTVYQVGTVHDAGPMGASCEDVTATDSDGDDIGSPMDLIRVSFERAGPAAQWTQRRKLTAGGSGTAVDGTTAVLGPSDGGPATVLTRTDTGWTQDGEFGDGDIAGAPALSGETVVFGSDDDSDPGSVLVYTRTDGSWEQQATLRPDDLDAGAAFGYSFDVDGDTLVVGAPEADGAVEGSEGVVYVYTRADGTWRLDTTLEDTRDVDDPANGLGTDVAVDGDTVLAGAPYTTYYDFGYADVGAGLVFGRADGTWRYEAFLRSTTPASGDFQGETVALEGDTAVLASPRANKDTSLTRYAGAAWVFTRDGSGWSQQTKVVPDDWDRGSWFGSSVSLSGDTMLVGADTRDRNANDASGSAYIFTRDGSAWDQLVRLTAADGESRDQFGSSVTLAGTFAFVDAQSDENPDGSDGSTYIFER